MPDFPPLVDVPFTIGADEYANNRFFMLDLPALEPNGRSLNQLIDPNSVMVFQSVEPGPIEYNEINFAAVYVDSAGCGVWDDLDFQNPAYHCTRWRIINSYAMYAEDGSYLGIDLGMEYEDDGSYLAVIYDVVDVHGVLVYRVGNRPGVDEPSLSLDPSDALYYRMKLLKTPFSANDPHVFQYVRRNIYSLNRYNLDFEGFDLQIEAMHGGASLEMANETVPWIRLFGLDQVDNYGIASPDGVVDWTYIDGARGLLFFPFDFPHPFAAESDQYLDNVESGEYAWQNSYLQQNLMPEIYDPLVDPDSYSQFRSFQITGHTRQYDYSGILAGEIRLGRTEWFWSSAPAQTMDGDRQFLPENRADHLRWFQPRERVLERYLDPDLTGTIGDDTVPTLDLFLWEEDGPWESETWGGIMRAVSRTGADLSLYSGVEVWVNDGQTDRESRSGRLHIEFGFISEDGFWPENIDTDDLIIGQWEREDGILENPASPDGIWESVEDVGLNYQGYIDDSQVYDADYGSSSNPFPQINGTAGNNREDSEDLNDNTRFDFDNAYFSQAINLKDTQPVVDVIYDYENVDDLVSAGIAWRKYWLPMEAFSSVAITGATDRTKMTHLRLWYENNTATAPAKNHIQFARLKFVR